MVTSKLSFVSSVYFTDTIARRITIHLLSPLRSFLLRNSFNCTPPKRSVYSYHHAWNVDKLSHTDEIMSKLRLSSVSITLLPSYAKITIFTLTTKRTVTSFVGRFYDLLDLTKIICSSCSPICPMPLIPHLIFPSKTCTRMLHSPDQLS